MKEATKTTSKHLNPEWLRSLVKTKATLTLTAGAVLELADYIETVQTTLKTSQKPTTNQPTAA